MITLQAIIDYLVQYGYIGLFILAFISNAIPYSTIPYLFLVVPILARAGSTGLVTLTLSLTAGATIGKLIVFLLGRFLVRIEKVKKMLGKAPDFVRKHKTSIFMTIFLVAALPIPDDVFYIPIGSSNYNIIYFALALFLGKLVITTLTAIYGVVAAYVLEEAIGLDPLTSIPILIALTALLMIIIGKINWEEVEDVYSRKGSFHAFLHVIALIIHIVFVKPIIKLISLLKHREDGR
ncbi:MAG: VTT domain-containing protein [Desulfurococcaceae archaeon]